MTSLFLDVLNTSFSATWVILAVAAARLALKKAPRWMVCGLWALVAARLLIGSGITAPFSMIPSTEVIPPQSLYEQAPVIHSGVTILDDAINPVYTESLRPMPGSSVNPLQIWTAVCANLWISGMAVMVIWAAVSWFRVRRQVRESIWDNGIYLCDRIESPFIFGLFRPKIYLPSELSEYARSHVIAHEKAHLRRRDHWWKPLGFMLLTINWFNPAMWVAYILLCRDIEMACDEKVVRDFSVEEKKAYSAALLRCSVNPRRITACPLAFGEVGVKQRVQSVLHYKKPAFWVILATLILAVVLGLGLLTSPAEKVSEIRYKGNLYVLQQQEVSFLPVEDECVGDLVSILHNTNEHPTEDFQGTNLEEHLAGCPLYLEDDRLYLQKFDGTCLVFRRVQPHGFLSRELERDLDVMVMAEGAQTDGWESLHGSQKTALRQLLEPLTTNIQFTPITERQAPDDFLTIDYFTDGGVNIIFSLRLSGDDLWTLHFYDVELGENYWQFRSEDLTAWAQFYLRRAVAHDPIFNGKPQSISYRSAEYKDLTMTLGAPDGWSSPRALPDPLPEGRFGLRCRPAGSEQWMDITFHDTEDTLYYYYPGIQSEPITLSNGVTGTLYHPGDPARWSMISLDTTRGQLHITTPDNVYQSSDWTDEDYRMARAIVETISIYNQDSSLLALPAPSESEGNLGITLRVENVTQTGLTLVYTHAGDPEEWEEICTSPRWTLERLENGGWVNIMPEEVGWTEVLYTVPVNGTKETTINFTRVLGTPEPGWYRIGKTFWGHPEVDIDPTVSKPTIQATEQTCYAVFEINPLGISLRAEDVTPNGATLVCTQDGTLWETITTGSAWTLEQRTESGWVSVLPEDTTWTAIAIPINRNGTTSWNLNWSQIAGGLEPGGYRVGKTFMGFGAFTVDGDCAVGEGARQTCYAEFLIDQPPIISPQEQDRLSDELRQALQEHWRTYDAMSEFDRLASSQTPGYCTRAFDSWTDVENFVGMDIPNPLEELDSLEKGNWAAMPTGYNGSSRFYITWTGTREGHVNWVQVQSGYRRGDLRVCISTELRSDFTVDNTGHKPLITQDSGEGYEARTGTLIREPIAYSIRVLGEPGTGDELAELLEELLPYFDAIPAA